MLPFSDPSKLKTKRIVFEDVISARDSCTLEHLKELSSRRRLLDESINGSSTTSDAISRELSGGSTSRCQQDLIKLEEYLPLLESLIYHTNLITSNSKMVKWISKLNIRWTTALSSSCLLNRLSPKYFQLDDLRLELGMVLFLYGAILRDRASELMPSDMKQSAYHFRKAAGVFDYLARDILPTFQFKSLTDRPAEATTSLTTVMSLICLAEAQAVAIQVAEEHYSVGLKEMLHCGITQFLDEADQALRRGTRECKSISSRVSEFISSCKYLHELQSKKYQAQALIKLEDPRVGVAVGVLREALITAKKHRPVEDSWKAIYIKEIENVTDMLRKLEREVEIVCHEKVPPKADLPSLRSRKMVHCEPYQFKILDRQLILHFKI